MSKCLDREIDTKQFLRLVSKQSGPPSFNSYSLQVTYWYHEYHYKQCGVRTGGFAIETISTPAEWKQLIECLEKDQQQRQKNKSTQPLYARIELSQIINNDHNDQVDQAIVQHNQDTEFDTLKTTIRQLQQRVDELEHWKQALYAEHNLGSLLAWYERLSRWDTWLLIKKRPEAMALCLANLAGLNDSISRLVVAFDNTDGYWS